jgi:protease-4
LVFLAALALALGCTGRTRSGAGVSGSSTTASLFGSVTKKVVEIDLSKGVPEAGGGGLFAMPASRTFVGLVRTLERVRDDQDAKGVFVRLGDTSIGYSRTDEVGRLLGEIRKQGKPVVCHADGLDNASTWLVLAGCDRIWLSPAGEISSVGLAGQVIFIKGALDKLKVNADFLHMGKYKSAVEMFTRESPSDEARKALTETLASLRKTWLDGIEAARKNPKHRADVEHGPWSAREAKDRGLVDELGFESDALADAKKRAGTERTAPGFGSPAAGKQSDLGDLIRILAGGDERSAGRPHVAVVVAEGEISMAAGGLFSGAGITANAYTKLLRRLAKDESVKAVVIRMDSPGGSALASDIIWHEVRELKAKKPVVVSVGDMAASGGYYIACAANRVLAEKSSIVGSIGVFGGKITVDAMLAEYGVTSATIPASPEPGAAERAAYLSLLTPWDESTRERVRKQMEGIYQLFLERVAESRGMPVPKVHEIAQGRIWSGIQGLDIKLVDEIGGLGRAIEIARDLGKLDDRAPVVVEGQSDGFFETLLGAEPADADAAARTALALHARKTAVEASVPQPLRPFLASVSPLMGRETTVAALPFALVVR